VNLSEPEARSRLATARVARLATADASGRPHLVPVTFAVDSTESAIYIAIDHKPKTTTNLKRLRNIRENPAVSLLADHYEDDWTRLWWVRFDGVARLTTTEELTLGLLRDGPTIPVRLDFTFEPSTPPWGFGEGMDSETWADVHYEHAGRFTGTLHYGSRSVTLAGTGYRDHSTGPRDVGPMLSHTWVHGRFPGGRGFQVFAAHTRPDQRFASAYVALGDELRAVEVRSVPGWQGRDGDPGSFVVSLETENGPAQITGHTLPQRYHWSALIPWEFAFGADLDTPDGPGAPWPVLETMVALEWDGEPGYGLLEMTRPRSG